MSIRNISIIGLGLIGGSIAKALKKSDLSLNINAFDKPDILTLALEDQTIDSKLLDITDALESDLIFICLPVNLSLDVFSKLAPKLKQNTIITDVCGVKGIFKKTWDSLKSEGIYIGGHPMTGKEKGGYKNSDPLLFENSIYILTDCDYDKIKKIGFEEIIRGLGSRITCIDSDVHDLVVANVSHMPQLLSVALVNSSVGQNSQRSFIDFAAGGFRDMTRIASSDFSIWEPIVHHNREKILDALSQLSAELEEVKKMVTEGDFKKLDQKFENARIKRDEIPRNTKGFLTPLFDIFVFVKDEPGVISKISSALSVHNLNIKDIELLKIREGSGGTFRLSFESAEDAEKAHEYLRKVGYETK